VFHILILGAWSCVWGAKPTKAPVGTELIQERLTVKGG